MTDYVTMRLTGLDIWGEEGGHQLVLHRSDTGHVVFGIEVISSGGERRRLGEVSIARFRLARIANFLVPEETEVQHQRAVEHVRMLIKEALDD